MTLRRRGRVVVDVPAGPDPIPLDALRDLISLTRALYVTFRGMGAGYDQQLFKLAQIGAKLGRAHEKAERRKATEELGKVVDVYLPAKALITVSGERVFRRR